MSTAALGSFITGVKPPLAIGTLLMEDGEQVLGLVCEDYAVRDARDISAFGGWRAYLKEHSPP